MFAPLDMAAALARWPRSSPAAASRSPPVLRRPTPRRAGSPPRRDAPLTQEALWDRLSRALTPGNVVLADQGTSFYGMADAPAAARA